MTKDSGRLSGSRKPSPAVSALAGFDPERIVPVRTEALSALLCSVFWGASYPPDWRAFWDWDYVIQAVFDKPGANKFEADIRPAEFAELLKVLPGFVLPEALAIAMEARQGTDPTGLDGEAATARAEGIAR